MVDTDELHGDCGRGARIVRLVEREVVDSTNLEAERVIRGGVLDDLGPGSCVQFVGGVQTGGVGRRGDAWQSPPGGLWTTVVMPLEGGEAGLGVLDGLGLRLGMAVLRVLREVSGGRRVALKWPNDLLMGERKVCGCLARHVTLRGRGWVLAGVGVNVNNPIQGVEGLRRPATSLSEELGRVVDLRALRERMGMSIARALAERGIPRADLEEARASLALVGSWVRVRAGSEVMEGTLEGLSEEGTPLLRTAFGAVVATPSGVEPLHE